MLGWGLPPPGPPGGFSCLFLGADPVLSCLSLLRFRLPVLSACVGPVFDLCWVPPPLIHLFLRTLNPHLCELCQFGRLALISGGKVAFDIMRLDVVCQCDRLTPPPTNYPQPDSEKRGW